MKYIVLFFACILSMTQVVKAQIQSDTLNIEEFTYDTENDLKIYCVRPLDYNEDNEYPAIVIFHGGGWYMGEASWGFSNAEHYAQKGMIAFSVQYRLQDLEKGITPYESVLDAQTALRWVRKNSDTFSINKNKIASYGWSAGAHLAACATIFDNLDAPNEDISSAPNLLALKSPALSLLIYSDFQNRLLDKIDVKNLSPAENVSENTPPTIIVMGRTDTVTPLQGSELFKKNMNTYGNDCKLVIYDNVGHLFTPETEPDNGWPNPDKKVSLKAQEEIDKFLKTYGYIH